MSSNAVLIVLGILASLLATRHVIAWRNPAARQKLRLVTSAALVLFALFCLFGYFAAGELQGQPRIAWQTGYGVLGAAALVGACFMAMKKRKS